MSKRQILTPTTLRLFACLLAVLFGSAHAGAQALCPATEELSLNSTFRQSPGYGVRSCYQITVPSAGMLFLDASRPTVPVAKLRLDFLGDLGEAGSGKIGGNRMIQATLSGAIVHVSSSGIYFLAVTSSHPSGYKVRNAFVPEVTTSGEIVTFDQDPPASCNGATLIPHPFGGDDIVIIEQAVDEEDCDVLEGEIEEPGVLLVESGSTPLHVAVHADPSCMALAVVDRVLAPEGEPLAVPFQSGDFRLMVEAAQSGFQPYELGVRFFAPCGLGESDDHGDTPLCGTALVAGGAVDGVLESPHGDDEDVFTFVLDQRQTVTIEVIGLDGGLAVLEDADGRRVASVVRGGSGRPIVETLEAGRYAVRLWSLGSSLVTAYSVRLGAEAVS